MGTPLDSTTASREQLRQEIERLRRVERESGKELDRLACETAELREVQLAHAQLVQQLRREQQQLVEATARLERSNRDLEQFAYVASHDLMEPLRMISAFLELLQRRYQGQLDEQADKFIYFAVDGAKRMQALINDLLAYSRITTRGKPFEPTDAAQALSEAKVNLQASLAETEAQITHGPLPRVLADRRQIVQLFQNLIANAVKYRGADSPCVHVAAQRDGDAWQFSVGDNGIGFEPQFAERIFVIFQRLHTREAYPGTGIGLAICKRIVERHGGSIWAQSQPGVGTTFYFTIPESETTRQHGDTHCNHSAG